MFWLITQAFITVLSFIGSLTTKCVSLNNEPCMVRPTLSGLNPVELNCHSFKINVDKCSEVVILLMTILQKYVF